MQTENKKEQYLEPVGFKGTIGKWKRASELEGDEYASNIVVDNWNVSGKAVIAKAHASLYFDLHQTEANAKLISQSKELAKALQDIKNECHKLLEMYADNADKNNAYSFAIFRSGVGSFIEKAATVLKEAGLTNE